VLCGRGVNIAHYSGNERFRTLVNAKKEAANLTNIDPLSGTMEKRHLAEEIIKHIKGLDPPGRFLKRNMPPGRRSRGKNGNGLDLSGMWEILSDREAVKKACQALRDCARTDRNGYALGVVAPTDVKELELAASNNKEDCCDEEVPKKGQEEAGADESSQPRQAEALASFSDAQDGVSIDSAVGFFNGSTKREASHLIDTMPMHTDGRDQESPVHVALTTTETNEAPLTLVSEEQTPLPLSKYATQHTTWRKRYKTTENNSAGYVDVDGSAVVDVDEVTVRVPLHLSSPTSPYPSPDGSGGGRQKELHNDASLDDQQNMNMADVDLDSRLTADFLDDPNDVHDVHNNHNHQSNNLSLNNEDAVALSMLEDPGDGSPHKDHSHDSHGQVFHDDSNHHPESDTDHFETDASMSSFLHNHHIHSHSHNHNGGNSDSDPFQHNRDDPDPGILSESDHPGASLLRPPQAELLRNDGDQEENHHLGEFHEHEHGGASESERVLNNENVRNHHNSVHVHEPVDWTAEDAISVTGSNHNGVEVGLEDVGADTDDIELERERTTCTVGEYDAMAMEGETSFSDEENDNDKPIHENFSLSVDDDGDADDDDDISYPDDNHSNTNPFASSSADITSDVAMFENPT
jgi:hypothetical protein